MVNTKWKEVSVKDLMKIETGSRNTEDKIDNGQYPFFVRSQTVEHIDSFRYDCEAVLTAGDGVGTGKVFHYINGKFNAHQRVYVMSQFKDVLGKYFYYWFSKNFFAEVAKYTAKSSVDSVRKQMIAGMVLPLPSAEEQQKIVGILSDIDTLITNLQKLIQKKKDIRQGTMQMLVTGKKRLGNFSGEWFDCTLDSIAYVLNGDRGVNYPSGDDFIEYGIPFINAGNISNNIVDVSTVDYISIEKYNSLGGVKIQKNDIIFCLRGSLGKCAISNFTGGAPASSLCVIRAKDGIDARFLFHIINSEITSRQIDNLNAGSSQPNLSAKSLKSFKFIIPKDVAEQEMISNILSDMDLDIYKLEEKLSKYQKIKQGMMEELLTGKVRLM